jgi:hypothetical protein
MLKKCWGFFAFKEEAVRNQIVRSRYFRTYTKLPQLGAPTKTVLEYGEEAQQRWGGFV